MSELLRRLKAFLNRGQLERELEEEMRFHLDQSGRASFGRPTRIMESSREAWVGPWIETFGQDVRYAWRSLRANRGFTAVALLSLAFGIGANTAIFSVIDAILLKSLPVDHPEQLYVVERSTWRGERRSTSYPHYRAARERKSFDGTLFAWGGGPDIDVRLNGHQEHIRARYQMVSGNSFDALGIRATIGRALLESDENKIHPAHVAVISYGFWQRALQADPQVLSRSLDVDGTVLQIVGVVPPAFYGLTPTAETPDFYVPLTMQPAFSRWGPMLDRPGSGWLTLLLRLPPHTTPAAAQQEIDAIWRQMQKELDPKREERTYDRIRVSTAHNGFDAGRNQISKPLFVLMATVGLVLLIACANIANLQLARGAARRREIGVRLAMGASRARIIRQLLTEGLVLAAGGALLGLLFARWGHTGLLWMMQGGAGIPSAMNFHLDWRTLGFTSAVSLLTVLLFALIPAVRATSLEVNPVLKKDSRAAAGGGLRSLLGRSLLAVQVGLSLLLLVGAGLFVRTFRNLMNVDTGFVAANVIQVQINGVGEPVQRSALYHRVLDRIRAMPGVQSASIAQNGLFGGGTSRGSLSVEGYTPKKDEDYVPLYLEIGTDYFRTMGTPLLLGRDFNERDILPKSKVVIVNEAMARYFWGKENPIGKRVSMDNPAKTYDVEVVGVAKDVKYDDLRKPPPRLMYRPLPDPFSWTGPVMLILKTTRAPEQLMPTIRREILAENARIRIDRMHTLPRMIADTLTQQRLVTQLVTFFGVAALVLAAVGLYGMLAYSVVRRTGEIGIRMALGALRRDVLWLIVKESLGVVMIGLACGVAASLALGRLLESMLFEIKPSDPVALASACALLLAVAALAAWLPARRASRIDPTEALRYE